MVVIIQNLESGGGFDLVDHQGVGAPQQVWRDPDDRRKIDHESASCLPRSGLDGFHWQLTLDDDKVGCGERWGGCGNGFGIHG